MEAAQYKGHCSEWADFKVNDFDGLDMQNDFYNYFTEGKQTPLMLLLSVLVSTEMFNALNALSKDGRFIDHSLVV